MKARFNARVVVMCLGAVCVTALWGATASAIGADWPDRIDLPDGFRPEGVATGDGAELFVGSIPTGRVLRVDARTGEWEQTVAGGTGRAAIGLKIDGEDRLFVAGGATGKAFIYDANSGSELAQFQLAAAGEPTFINDVVLTDEAAFFTDSRQPAIYAVKSDLSEFRTIALPGFPMGAGNNLNGIVATPDGSSLLAVQTAGGNLWHIDPATGGFAAVDLGGVQLTNGDGLLLHGHRMLYVVQSRSNQVAVVRLDAAYATGVLVDTLTSGDFDVPTTAARVGDRLYLPNARFTTTPTPETDYWITQIHR